MSSNRGAATHKHARLDLKSPKSVIAVEDRGGGGGSGYSERCEL